MKMLYIFYFFVHVLWPVLTVSLKQFGSAYLTLYSYPVIYFRFYFIGRFVSYLTTFFNHGCYMSTWIPVTLTEMFYTSLRQTREFYFKLTTTASFHIRSNLLLSTLPIILCHMICTNMSIELAVM
jgi:hypothetical protein